MASPFTLTREKDSDGVEYVVPRIGIRVLWRIPASRWSDGIEQALIRAYEKGWNDAEDAHMAVEAPWFPMGTKFEEER